MHGRKPAHIDRTSPRRARCSPPTTPSILHVGTRRFIRDRRHSVPPAEIRHARCPAGPADKDPTIAELLKPHATPRRRSARTTSATQRVPSHRNGFDEFYGIPTSQRHGRTLGRPINRRLLNPRHCPAQHHRHQGHHFGHPTTDPRWGRLLGQATIADAGPLPAASEMGPKAKFSMEDVDDELFAGPRLHRPRRKANKPSSSAIPRVPMCGPTSHPNGRQSGHGMYCRRHDELDAAVAHSPELTISAFAAHHRKSLPAITGRDLFLA